MPEGRSQAPPLNADDIVALATPSGRGALGVVRLCGLRAQAIACSLLGVPSLPARKPVLRSLRCGEETLDKALVTFFPSGYTGEPCVEFSVHASPYVIRTLLELCRRAGARDALPGEFTQRAYLNGKLDLAQAEAVCELIASGTRAAHRGAVERLEGGLQKRVESLRLSLTEALAGLLARLDHPDEDLSDGTDPLCRALEGLRAAAQASRRGRALGSGLRVVLAGPPNAGKSSLLNALLGADRAIVSERPGTTRDTLEADCELGGLALTLVDTAGLREHAPDPVEAEGVLRSHRAQESSDLTVLVLDAGADPAPQTALIERLAKSGRKLVVALNKQDLPRKISPQTARACCAGAPVAEVSALNGQGLEDLARMMKAELGPKDEEVQEPWSIGISERACIAFERAEQEASEAQKLADSPELAAQNVRAALDALDAVCGETTQEDVLNAVFSRFCIGK
ncbi:MAG: tRNA uridine-5-carboxymethylaminomethyl(34) synthesis GTPase MnmE [Elusimicrobiota bacterium]